MGLGRCQSRQLTCEGEIHDNKARALVCNVPATGLWLTESSNQLTLAHPEINLLGFQDGVKKRATSDWTESKECGSLKSERNTEVEIPIERKIYNDRV